MRNWHSQADAAPGELRAPVRQDNKTVLQLQTTMVILRMGRQKSLVVFSLCHFVSIFWFGKYSSNSLWGLSKDFLMRYSTFLGGLKSFILTQCSKSTPVLSLLHPLRLEKLAYAIVLPPISKFSTHNILFVCRIYWCIKWIFQTLHHTHFTGQQTEIKWYECVLYQPKAWHKFKGFLN